MKWTPSAYHADTVELTLWDLVKLFFGKVLTDGGCRVMLGKRPTHDT